MLQLGGTAECDRGQATRARWPPAGRAGQRRGGRPLPRRRTPPTASGRAQSRAPWPPLPQQPARAARRRAQFRATAPASRPPARLARPSRCRRTPRSWTPAWRCGSASRRPPTRSLQVSSRDRGLGRGCRTAARARSGPARRRTGALLRATRPRERCPPRCCTGRFRHRLSAASRAPLLPHIGERGLRPLLQPDRVARRSPARPPAPPTQPSPARPSR